MKEKKQNEEDATYYNRCICCAVVFVGVSGGIAAYFGKTSIYSVQIAMLLIWFCLYVIK